ncbi:AraC-like ligand-binding domain-containing protein [Allostreptomyces psammosilenae]|uniref:AraC-like DNA-binding protein n=1 Tax=Allostreptomyces psammosilenae TaxID=1892865 RepID=A0A853A2J8_9ACTN|nr:helix-turn-helix domain-containing protein [Allostreptomyces psammosilenae]NYI04678.1 AraC-like DNA-binding protein [Allostreptomyces psammosilenae]
MRETVFDTAQVPAADRFEFWRDSMARAMCPTEVSSAHAEGFAARMRLLRLGSVQAWPTGMQAMSWRRTPRLIRQADPEYYHLTLTLRGALAISQAGRAETHTAGRMYVIDTSRPFDCFVPGDSVEGVGLEVPRALLPLPSASVDRLLTRHLPRRGVGGLLATVLLGLVEQTGALRPSDGARLETVLTDLLAATLAHHLEEEDRLTPESRTRSLVLSVRAFILRHLPDPDLDPGTIAAAHHISVSQLHRLFRGEDDTVAAYLRRQRLERARRDLADLAQHATPVNAIGRRWGFTHHAAFSRAFRAAYGIPPRDYRERQRAGEPADGPGR